ncbi:ATP-binding protein [Streptomyces sp. 8N706]|uniref:ATP-binding protein n=1 Tax=Streptomyces sp. 8N706 TaxID=3457416 RepID=UPI003FCEECC7
MVTSIGLDMRAVAPANEMSVHLADRVARELELPGNLHSLAWARRNKAAMRDHAVAAGVRIPKHRLVERPAEIPAIAREIGFPVIVKPTMGACSQGTTVLPEETDVNRLEGLVTHDVFGQSYVAVNIRPDTRR